MAQLETGLTRCPKCGGKVFVNRDYDGLWEECLQCGWERAIRRRRLLEPGKRHEARPAAQPDS